MARVFFWRVVPLAVLLLALVCKSALGGCVKTGKDLSSTNDCNEDGCCDDDAVCTKKGTCLLPENEKCDNDEDCDGDLTCDGGRCSCGGCKEREEVCLGCCGYQGCSGKKDHSIDWECVLGDEAESEVERFGGEMYACEDATPSTPCTTFRADKDVERAEVKVDSETDDFFMEKGETWEIRYSVRPDEDMKMNSNRFTHLGQLKPSKDDAMLAGTGLYALTANDKGLSVRFSSQGGDIEDFYTAENKIGEDFLDWDDVRGKWVHVEIIVKWGRNIKVLLTGAVEGKYKWPKGHNPIVWSSKTMDSVRLKLGAYHSKGNVGDAKVSYKDVSLVGPADREIITHSSPEAQDDICRDW